jgi:hypothetical protein
LGPKLVFPPILVISWVSSCLSFFLSASTAATYIYLLLLPIQLLLNNYSWTLCIKCWFQDFILRFNKTSLLCRYHWGDRRWKWAQRHGQVKVTFPDNSITSLYFPHNVLCFNIVNNFVIKEQSEKPVQATRIQLVFSLYICFAMGTNILKKKTSRLE